MKSGDLVVAKGSHGVYVYQYDDRGFWVWNGTIASAFQLHVYLSKVPHVKNGRLSYFNGNPIVAKHGRDYVDNL